MASTFRLAVLAAVGLLLHAEPAVVLVDRPVTVTVAVPEGLRQANIAFLKLNDVVVSRKAQAAWNIFWELPDANERTSVDHPHFAGYVTSLTNSAAKHPSPANFNVQLPEPAVLAMRRLRAMRFTFVPTRKLPEGGVVIGSLGLE